MSKQKAKQENPFISVLLQPLFSYDMKHRLSYNQHPAQLQCF